MSGNCATYGTAVHIVYTRPKIRLPKPLRPSGNMGTGGVIPRPVKRVEDDYMGGGVGGGIVGKVKQEKGKLAIKGPRLLASRFSQPKTSPIWKRVFLHCCGDKDIKTTDNPLTWTLFSVNLIITCSAIAITSLRPGTAPCMIWLIFGHGVNRPGMVTLTFDL